MKKNPEQRFTVADRVYCQIPNLPPTELDLSLTYYIQKEEQPFFRSAYVKPSWEKVNLGWIENPSFIILRNRHLIQGQTIPSREELEENAKHLIEIKFEGPSLDTLFLAPGDSIKLRTKSPDKLYIRSTFETTGYTILAIPE